MSMWFSDIGNGEYRNPLLFADYSDPDAIRVGDDYFMTASSFCNTPGLPILHSKDLVNWKVVNYALDNIPFDRFDKPCHGCGVWAPSIRYHDSWFYIFFPMPDEGIFVTKTRDPFGDWSEPVCILEGKGYIDPCPLWDGEKAYMVMAYAKSRIGFKSILSVAAMEPDCSKLLESPRYVFDGNINNQETIEGPKFYKRNGYYYIFAPAGGVKTGWQVVLRSKDVYGPYEYRNVMIQADTKINGPHQGALVDTQSGEEYFLHFQDVYAAGRIVHMQPVMWENDWPIIGERCSDIAGKPVMTYKKPDIGKAAFERLDAYKKEKNLPEIYSPEVSDYFLSGKLSLCWQWNANHYDNFYELTDTGLKLFALGFGDKISIADLPNLLLQKWPAPNFSFVTKMSLGHLTEGDICGIVSMGMTYCALAVLKTDDSLYLISIKGDQIFKNEVAMSKDDINEIGLYDADEIFFKYTVDYLGQDKDNVPQWRVYMSYSQDGELFENVISFNAVAGRWVGVKEGIFCYNQTSIHSNGYAVIHSHIMTE